MNLEIRYLLHGQSNQYDDRKPLYVVSQENSKWFNLGKELLEIDQESWRLIEPALSKAIPPTEYERLNITTFTIDAIIEKIRESGAERLSEINISDTDKEELLIEIGQRGNNQVLWKELPFHKTKSGDLVSIDETTFLNNTDSNVSSRLKKLEQESSVKIIKRSESSSLNYLQEKEIPLWDSFSAIKVILTQANPSKYCDLILEILKIWKSNKEFATFKQQYEEKLREISWLRLKTGDNIAPKNIIRLPKELAKYTKIVAKLGSDYYSKSYYSEEDLELSGYQSNSISKLFEKWYQEKILDMLLYQESPSDYIEIIIDVLQVCFQKNNLDIPHSTWQNLQHQSWIITENGKRVSPSQVIDISKFKVASEAQKILEFSDSDYVTLEMLDSRITHNETVLKWVKQKLLIKGTKALEIIGDSAGKLASYRLGEFNQSEFPLEDALEVFEGIDADILPCWSLVEKIASYQLETCKEFILPKNSNPLENKVIIKLLNWIREYKGTDEKAIGIYNKYLSLAVNHNDFYDEILNNILLLNRRLEWKSPSQLAETTENIDESYLLNEEQEEILQPYLPDFTIDEPEEEANQEEEINNKEPCQLLQEYFGEWQTYVNDEAIGAFLCLIAGSDKEIKRLAQEFLLKRNFDDVLTRLIGTEEPRHFEITIQAKGENTKQLKSLTGKYFTARLQSEENFKTFYLNQRLDETTQQLKLVPITISTETSQDKLARILKESVLTLITKVYCIDSNSLPESFEEVWEDLNKSEQLDIKVTRGVILDSVKSTIESLGVHSQNQELKAKFDEIHNAIQQREEFRNRNNQEKVIKQEESINQLKQSLGNVLEEENSEIASATLKAVREQIGHHQFGYQKTSVPFEIFQNADDALVELEMMAQNQPLDEDRLQFFINCAKPSTIMMMHWGRPINCFIHPNYRGDSYKDKGFDKDLQKMLSFNYSDKSNNVNQPDSHTTVTGKFGLGFKSIYLICREPHVLSHRLGFKVVGGLLPSRLTALDSKNLKYEIKQFESYIPQFLDQTVIKLPLDSSLDLENSDILDLFERLIGILLIFAKKIKTCKILTTPKRLPEKYEWNPVALLGNKTIEIGKIKLNKSENEKVNVICLKLDDSGHFVLPINDLRKMSSALNKAIPNIWVTAPTQEKLDLSFIINAHFDVNTGRSTIIESEDNLKLANQLGEVLGKQLCKLFELTQYNWDYFLELLQLQEITPYQFWEFIWQELAVSLLDKPETGSFGLIRKILGGESKGMGYFLINCPALPNGLPKQHKDLVLATEVQYIIEGTLKEDKHFNQVWEWEFVKDDYPINQVIHGQVWEQFNQLLKFSPVKQKFQVQSLYLPDILKCLFKSQKVTPNLANQIGELVTPDFLEELKVSRKTEHQKFIDWLSQTKLEFLTQKQDNYQPIQQLLDKEDELLSAFSPPEYVLSDEYKEQGLAFFRACRQEKYSEKITADTLIDWISKIGENSEKEQKVIDYVLYLKFSQVKPKEELAEKLRCKFDWIKRRTEIQTTAPSIPETTSEQDGEDDGTGDSEYGEIGEQKAVEFYEKYYYSVENRNHNNPENPGFDLECSQPKSPENSLPNIKVEVKAITYDRPRIRLTQTEWNFMVRNKDRYELFIYAHDQGEYHQTIRIKKAWLTLRAILEKLDTQEQSKYPYNSKKFESIIGLQQNSNGEGNDILIHWHRLLRDDSHQEIELDSNGNW